MVERKKYRIKMLLSIVNAGPPSPPPLHEPLSDAPGLTRRQEAAHEPLVVSTLASIVWDFVSQGLVRSI